MANETATATNPTDASASSEASATTLLATASGAADKTQQTQTTQTPAAAAAEKPAAAATATETPATPVVPEAYSFRAPEGTEYDPTILDSFSGAAKEAGLTQDAAQKLIEKMAPGPGRKPGAPAKSKALIKAEQRPVAIPESDTFDGLVDAVEVQLTLTPMQARARLAKLTPKQMAVALGAVLQASLREG